MTKEPDDQVISVDFVGTRGYMTQMFWYQDVLISHKTASFNVPIDIHELENLRRTLKFLYLWKKHLLSLSSKVISFLYSNKRRYRLIEACEEDESLSLSLTQVANVLITPCRKNKKKIVRFALPKVLIVSSRGVIVKTDRPGSIKASNKNYFKRLKGFASATPGYHQLFVFL